MGPLGKIASRAFLPRSYPFATKHFRRPNLPSLVMPVLFSPTTRSSARDSLAGMASNGTPMAKTPPGNAMSGAGAAELLHNAAVVGVGLE